MTLRTALLAGCAALLVAVAAAVVAGWAPDRDVDSLRARWAPPPSTFVTVQGMAVHVRDEGPRDDPLPVVLLHGTSASLHTWDGWAQALSGTRRVVRMDLPGFGLTGPHPERAYEIDAYVRFVLALCDALGVQRFVLAGNSLGGQIAWRTALAAPQRIERLVLVDAGGYPLAPASMPIGFRIAQHAWLAPLASRLTPRSVVARSVRNVYGDPDRVTEALIDRYYELTLRAGNRTALFERFARIVPGERIDDLGTLAMPTLILWGGRDRLIPPEHGQRFAQAIPRARVVVFDALGHVPQEEDPARTVAEVQAFLR
jgi:pimeloyl-ACP methyl ester carboxylesterase